MNKILLIILVLSLTACGYHLRQSGTLVQQHPKIYLDISSNSLLKHSLSNVLISSGIKLANAEDLDKSELSITKDAMVKHIQSIGANNRVQEYRIEYDVEFSFANRESKIIHLERDYSFDDQQIAGSQQEEVTLRKQLSDDMAWAIVRFLNQVSQ